MDAAGIRKVIESLKAQFNQDKEHDMKIVREYCETLTDSSQDQAILAAVARFAAHEYPDAEANQRAEKLGLAISEFHERIDELQKMAAERRFEEAAAGYAEILGEMDPVELDDRRLMSFNQPFEELLFRMRDKDGRPIVRISNLAEILYYQYASILFELRRYADAREQLEKCLKLDPVDMRVYFELAELAKLDQNFELVSELMAKVHPLIFTRRGLARYYRTQAFIENMRGNFRLAVAMVYVSLDYEESPVARAQLNALAKIKGTDLSRPKVEEVQALVQGTNIVLGPDQDVYGLAIAIGGRARVQNPGLARMAFAIAYDITHYKPLLRELAALGVK